MYTRAHAHREKARREEEGERKKLHTGQSVYAMVLEDNFCEQRIYKRITISRRTVFQAAICSAFHFAQ